MTAQKYSPKHRPITLGIPRSTSAGAVRRIITRQEASNVTEALRRVQPRHRSYVMARANGASPTEAWTDTMGPHEQASGFGSRLDERPSIKAAIAVATESVVRGSLMSAAQRRDWVLDRLIAESSDAGDSARIRALELIGKTAGLFIDKAEVSVQAGDAEHRIMMLLDAIKGRTLQGESQRVNEEEEETVEGEVIDEPVDEPDAAQPVVYTEKDEG